MSEINTKPALSVVIPTYNRAHLIKRSITSVLCQTYHDFELIIVDDNSTDNTREVVTGINDSRIRYIKHEKNMGNAAARNTGIKNSRAEYIAFQDDDDEWMPDKLEKQMICFTDPSSKIDVVYSGFWRTGDNKKTFTPAQDILQKEGNIHTELLKKNFITTPVVVIKKECFSKAGMFDENISRLVDWEMWIRVSKYYNFKYINKALLISEEQPDGIWTNTKILIQALEYILIKHFNDFKKEKKALARHCFSLAFMLMADGEIIKARHYFIKSVKFDPLKIKYLLGLLASLLGRDIYNITIKYYQKYLGSV
jgi:glycosyltransferase involved in cell wall biosynthesis